MNIRVQAHFVAPPPALVPTGDYIRRIAELREGDFVIAGRKGASLGELHNAHFAVPDGFVVTTPAYFHAMEVAGVRSKLLELSRATDPGNPATLARDAKALRALVEQAGVSGDLKHAVTAAYRALGDAAHVIVRSSASHEDRAGAALIDRSEIFLDVTSEAELLSAIVSCWKSVWTERLIAHRAAQGRHGEPAVAVVVQRMVKTKTSGAVLTTDPQHPDSTRIELEPRPVPGAEAGAAHEAESYLMNKLDRRLTAVHTAAHAHCSLSEHELFELLSLAGDVERHFRAPQHVEWALHEGTLYVLRSRPLAPTVSVTTGSPALGA